MRSFGLLCTKTAYVGQPADNHVDTILNDIANVSDSTGKQIQCFIDQLVSIDNKVKFSKVMNIKFSIS